jgi:hypothetical protein
MSIDPSLPPDVERHLYRDVPFQHPQFAGNQFHDCGMVRIEKPVQSLSVPTKADFQARR